jgi:hypothetical protein
LGGHSERNNAVHLRNAKKLLQSMAPWPYPPPVAHLPSLKYWSSKKKRQDVSDTVVEEPKRLFVMMVPHSKPLLVNKLPCHVLNYVRENVDRESSSVSSSVNPTFVSKFLSRSSALSLPLASLVPPMHLASILRPNNHDIFVTKSHDVGSSSSTLSDLTKSWSAGSNVSNTSPFYPEILKVCFLEQLFKSFVLVFKHEIW